MLACGRLTVTIVTMSGRRKPQIVKVGSFTVPIYFTPTGERERFTVAYYEAGRRVRRVFDDAEAAKREAGMIAAKMATGNRAVLELSSADKESYVLARQELEAVGMPLHDAVRQYVTAMNALPAGASLMEAVQAFALRAKGRTKEKSVSDSVEEFLSLSEAEMARGGLSNRYVRTLRTHLRRFASKFQTRMSSALSRDIHDWLRQTAKAPKTWNNMRTSLVTFFRWARDRGYLAQEIQTEAEKVKRKKLGDSDVGTLTPRQIHDLLGSAGDEARLYLALGAFTGIRTAELIRLHWFHVDFEEGLIRLDRSVTKTKHKRIIPLLPNLALWLASYRGRKDRIFSSENATGRTIAFAKQQGIEWPSNCLRHSFGSYRTAVVKSHPQVALEMGNSVGMVKKHYDRVVAEKDAKAWFAVAPRDVATTGAERKTS